MQSDVRQKTVLVAGYLHLSENVMPSTLFGGVNHNLRGIAFVECEV